MSPSRSGEPGPERRPIKQIGVNGEPAQVSLLTVGTHTGTHIDAPSHFIPGGATIDALPLKIDGADGAPARVFLRTQTYRESPTQGS